jgi:anti-sigma factor RsiW
VTCEALINKFLMDYAAGTLPLARKLEFEFHLSLCSDCRKYLASYQKTIELTKATRKSPDPIPEQLVEVILRTVKTKAARPFDQSGSEDR